MQPWLIVLITISSGIVLFGLIMCLKNRKAKNRRTGGAIHSSQPVMVVTSNTSHIVPSTSGAPRYNVGNSQILHQQPGIIYTNQSHMPMQFQSRDYHPQSQQIYQPPQQMYPVQPQQVVYPSQAQASQYYQTTMHKVVAQPMATAPPAI